MFVVIQIVGDGFVFVVVIDVVQLGGMYVNRVFLVGNFVGVGVVNVGMIVVQVGDLMLQLDGWFVFIGKIMVSGDMVLLVVGGIQNIGIMYVQQLLLVSISVDFMNSGMFVVQ